MSYSLDSCGIMTGLRPWCGIAVLVACLGLPGCKSGDPGGDGFREDPAFAVPQQFRSHDSGTGMAGVSDKSQQIERNLGIR